MEFSDIGLITDDVLKLASFYEAIFNVKTEGDTIHCFINVPGLTIAIYNKSAAQNDMGFDFQDAGTGLLTIGFNCEDADIEYKRIKSLNICCPTEPKVWTWGAKSFRFKDPDGNIILVRSLPK